MARDRKPEAEATEPPADDQPALAVPEPAKRRPDPELATMARISRALDALAPDARRRVGVWLSMKYQPGTQ